MTSLVQLIKSRYLESVRSVQPPNRWKILVLDEQTQSHIGSVLKMYDILDEGVQQVELISNLRNASPRLEAVYILTPSPSNISRIIKDFEPARPAQAATKKTPAKPATGGPLYAAAHCFFIDVLPDKECDRLADSPAGQHLKTLKEIYVNFWAFESQVFNLKFHDAFWSLYGPASQLQRDVVKSWEADLDFMAASLVNVCATLSEFPDIRFYAPGGCGRPILGPTKQHPTVVLAQKVYAGLVDYAKNNEGFATETDRPKGVLFVVDRSMDLAAPFLHEFTYQAMCNDLLDIKDGSKYHHSFRNEKGEMEEIDAILNDDDKVWTDVRHMHMKETLDRLIEAFKQYSNEHGSAGTSLNDLKDMLANLPGMKESKEKLSLHLSLAEQCMALFEKKKLPLTAMVEQSCATGLTAEGKTPKTLVEEMVPLLDDRSVSLKDKVRIIALYIMHRDGVPDEDRKRLYQHARLGPPEMDAINNLPMLGQEVTKDSKRKVKPVFKQTAVEEAYEISRYQPAVKLMVEEHFSGKLDRQAFPFVGNPSAGAASLRSDSIGSVQGGPPASLRSAKPRWTAGAKSKPSNEPRQRAIVFMAGGMTFSEIRSAYQVSQTLNKDVYIGSTHISSPEEFVRDLSNLDRAPPGSRPPPQERPSQDRQPSSSRLPPAQDGSRQDGRSRSPRPPDPRQQQQHLDPRGQYQSDGRSRSSEDRNHRPSQQQQHQQHQQQYAPQPQYTSSQGPPPNQYAPAPSRSQQPQRAPPSSQGGQLMPQSSFNTSLSNDSRLSVNSQGEPVKKEKRGLFGRKK